MPRNPINCVGLRDPRSLRLCAMEKPATGTDTINLQAVDVFALVRSDGVQYVTGDKERISALTQTSLEEIQKRIELLSSLSKDYGVADQAGACCESCCSKSLAHMFFCYCPCVMCGDCCDDLSTGKIADIYYVENDDGILTEVLVKFQAVESFGEQEKKDLVRRALGSELAALKKQKSQITKLSK